MKAIVIGATGATGKYLVQELINNPHYTEITVLVRRASFPQQSKLKEIVVDFNQLENFREYITGDVAYSVLGTTLKDAGSKDAQWKVDYDYQYQFAEICSTNQIPSFVLLSATGANPNSSIFYNKMKGQLEYDIKKLNFKQLNIIQPAGLIRPNSDRMGEKLMVTLVGALNAIGLLKNYQLIHVKDLAKAIVHSLTKHPSGINELNVKSIIQLIR